VRSALLELVLILAAITAAFAFLFSLEAFGGRVFRQPAVLTVSAEMAEATQCLIPQAEASPTPSRTCTDDRCRRVKAWVKEDASLPKLAPRSVPQ
jgi:hypothetical protein